MYSTHLFINSTQVLDKECKHTKTDFMTATAILLKVVLIHHNLTLTPDFMNNI